MSRPVDWEEVFGIGDPTPGTPWEIRSVARRWERVADSAEIAEMQLRGLLGVEAVATWLGQAGAAFQARSSELPGQLAMAKDSYRAAAEALSWWAGRLDSHQGDADAALVRGRQALVDLRAAEAQLTAALSAVTSAAGAIDVTSAAPQPPSPELVAAASARYQAAVAARQQAEALVGDASARLAAARSLAQQAGELRATDGRTTAARLHEAADAGIEPRSRWERFKDGVAKAWDVVITIAKIVVAVLGVVALIIGGPLAWIVLAAALLVLVDTLAKYLQGQASALDVVLAGLSCIPGTKGLTTLAALKSAFKAGGAVAATMHVVAAGRETLGVLAGSVAALPATANALRKGLIPSLKAAVQVAGREGATVTPSLTTTLREMQVAFTASMGESRALLHDAATWQGVRNFPGRDVYTVERLAPGTTLEAGFPGLGSYAMPGGTAASHSNSASAVWEGVQVGPQDLTSQFPGYRGSMVELQVTNHLSAATGTTLANPMYGAGGSQQYFLDLTSQIAQGNIAVIGRGGTQVDVPVGLAPTEVNAFLNQHFDFQGPIRLEGAGSWSPHVMTQQEVSAMHQHLPTSNDGALPRIDLSGVSTILRGAGYVGASQ